LFLLIYNASFVLNLSERFGVWNVRGPLRETVLGIRDLFEELLITGVGRRNSSKTGVLSKLLAPVS
jgi:hypothetical protein